MSTPILCFKVILIGNCKVGKTSFLNFITGRNISQKNVTPTIGVQYAPFTLRIGSNDVRVNIWDTSGAEQYKSITKSYYRKCEGVIVVFDLTDRRSFQDLRLWLKEIKLEVKSTKMPKIIIANKIDLVETGQKQRAISEKQLTDFCVQHGLNFRQTSAATGFNVRQTFDQFVQAIYDWKSHDDQQSSERPQAHSISLDREKPKITEEPSSCAKCC